MLVEACIRVVDKTNINQRRDAGCTKRGDIIEFLPIDSDWGKEITAGTEWRIIKVDIPATLIASLKATESGKFVHRQSRKRKFAIELNRMPNPLRNQMMNNVETVTDLSKINIAALTNLKPPL